jgi:putative hydrolase of the HAD superfamily
MAAVAGIAPDQYVDRWLATFSQRATGVYPTVRANIEAIGAALGVVPESRGYETAARIRLEFERRSIRPRPSSLAVLQALRARGLKTGLISDCSMELPEIWPETPFAALFDSAVFSSVVRVRKPDAKIYLESCRQLEVETTECVYVGDGGSQELTGASAVGMRAVLLSDPGEQGNPDIHRIDAQEWAGARISELNEIHDLIAAFSTEP